MVSFAVEAWGPDYEQVKRLCIRCEELGYHAFYYGESLGDMNADCWAVLAALAEATKRIRLGPAVTYILNGYRHPALLAKMAATLDVISGGRLDLRVGVGAPRRDIEPWWAHYGLDYPELHIRSESLEEGLRIIAGLWAADRFSFRGRHFQVNDAVCMPKPVQSPGPPIVVCGKRRELIKLALMLGQGWEVSYSTPDEYRVLLTRFEDVARESSLIGRTLRRGIEVDVIIGMEPHQLREGLVKFVEDRAISSSHPIFSAALKGTPEDCIERIKELISLGMENFTLAFEGLDEMRSIELFAEKVLSNF